MLGSDVQIGQLQELEQAPEIDEGKEWQTTQLEQVLVRLDEVWSRLIRRVSAEIKEYPFAIPIAQVNLLRLLDRLGAKRMSDLATHLDVTQSGCTALVDRAIETGLVERYRDENDRRVVWVTLSAAGNEALAELRRVRARHLAKYLRHLDVEELELLTRLLSRSTAAMSEPDSFDHDTLVQ